MPGLASRLTRNDYAPMPNPSSLEILEPRIAPAKLLGPAAFSYTDIDGDSVKVTFSKPILTEANFDSIVNLTGGLAGTGSQDLIELDLAGLGAPAKGMNITIVATPSKTLGGDSQIAALRIDAFDYDSDTDTITGIDLGTVNIDGDITFIDAGDDNSETFSIKSLKVKSVGMVEPGVLSDIYGPVGTVNVLGDFAGYFYAESDNLVNPDFKTITIRGSVLGNAGEDAGRIFAFSGIDNLSVGGDVIGGFFEETGSIRSAGPIEKVSIKGSIIGGDAPNTGLLRALEYTSISVRGSLVGGFGAGSGSIETYYGDIKTLNIYGSIIGGRGDDAAGVRAGDNFDGDGSIGTMTVGGSVIGIMPDSGKLSAALTIHADNSIGILTIKGSLVNANIVAGVSPGADNAYATADDALTADFPDDLRQIGSIVVKNGVYATTEGFAITATRIASILAGGPALKPGGPFADFDEGFLIGGGAGIRVMHF